MQSLTIPISNSAPPPTESWTKHLAVQALSHGERIAIISGEHGMTYAELWDLSSRIASRLSFLGVGRGSYVGLGLGRCLELPAALLGILKSGAAYIPIDPTYPTARIGGMITSARIEHVVTLRRYAEAFPGVTPVEIDQVGEPTSETSSPEYHGDDPIYAIFTSGSTGEPKAASVYHRGFANLLAWYISELGISPDDTTLVISSPSFDLTQKNFYAPLATGGTLVLDDDSSYDITRILNTIARREVTILNCTPSAFYPLVETAAKVGFAALRSLKSVVLGGEPISIPRLRPWLENFSCRADVINSYGPTECTDICAFHRLTRNNLDDYSFVPLGREVPNVQVSIRDDGGSVISGDDIGELWISGAGLGGGYLHDPARTASAFRDSSYRTGDLARRLDSGLLEFRGRADQQVKVNGFRIEMGEIENALERHEKVSEAIVIADADRFVAHVIGTAGIPELRDHLASLLPSHMIPREYRFADRFPLTPNGKTDRIAIAKECHHIESLHSVGSSLETEILALWSDILGHPVSDPTANFFDVGGDSIRLAILHVRLMRMSGREFGITELFAMPSVRTIADFLSSSNPTDAMHDPQRRARMARASFSNFSRTNRR